jgi:hypothetical protein
MPGKGWELSYQHAGEIRTELKKLQDTSEDSIGEPFSKWNIESLAQAPSQVLTLGDARGKKSAPAAEQSKPVEPPLLRRWLPPSTNDAVRWIWTERLLTRLGWRAESWPRCSSVTRVSFLVEWRPGTKRRMIARSDKVATLVLLSLAVQEGSTSLTGDEFIGAG